MKFKLSEAHKNRNYIHVTRIYLRTELKCRYITNYYYIFELEWI